MDGVLAPYRSAIRRLDYFTQKTGLREAPEKR
jgi:hypothetical protein